MRVKNLKSVITICSIVACLAVILVSLPVVVYLKVLPWAISKPQVIDYIEDVSSKTLSSTVEISKPVLKTGVSPDLYFGVSKIKVSNKKKTIMDIENLVVDISIDEILNK